MQNNNTENLPGHASMTSPNVATAPTEATAPTKPPMRLYGFAVKATEPEGYALEALRNWTRAQTDNAYHARLEAWELLKQVASIAEDGDMKEIRESASDNPELVAVAVIVAAYIKREVADMVENQPLYGRKRRDGDSAAE